MFYFRRYLSYTFDLVNDNSQKTQIKEGETYEVVSLFKSKGLWNLLMISVNLEVGIMNFLDSNMNFTPYHRHIHLYDHVTYKLNCFVILDY